MILNLTVRLTSIANHAPTAKALASVVLERVGETKANMILQFINGLV